MAKRFLCLVWMLTTALTTLGQDEPTHTITELHSLLGNSKTDAERVGLLLETALLYIMRPGADKHDMDSALHFLTRATDMSGRHHEPVWKARCFRVYSQLYRESGQREKGRQCIDSAVAILSEYGEKERLGDAYFELQRYYDVYSDSDRVFKVRYVELAENLYAGSGHKMKRAVALKHLGDLYQIKGRDSLALKVLHEALAIYRSVNYPQVQGLYDLIGFILFKAGDFDQALKYGLLAVSTAEQLRTDSQELSTIYNRIGMTCYRLSKYAEAGDYFSRSFSVAAKVRDTTTALIIAHNAMATYMRQEKARELIAFLTRNRFIYDKGSLVDKVSYLAYYINAYVLSGQVQKAAPLVRQLLLEAGNSIDFDALRSLHRAIIPYYLATGQYTEMYKYLPANERLCKQFSIISGLADTYRWWYKADSAVGNYPASMAHYKLYKEANDSVLNMKASQQINQLLIQHETYKKDQEIAAKESNIVLLTNQSKMQQQRLEQARLVRNLTYGLAGLLLVVMGLLYNRYRLKQRTNQKLEIQQREIARQNDSLQHLVNEKEWLVKEIHHRVKNNLHMVMGLLATQSGYLKNEEAATAVAESQRRIQAMTLIHQRLYQSNNLSAIRMTEYIHELVDSLSDSFETGNQIRFILAIEPVELGLAHCIPLGLILNEAITNSFKYAFPHQRKGTITIHLKNTGQHDHWLSIRDDGIGLPREFDVSRSDSMGMNLIRGLSAEIGAEITISGDNGTRIDIYFACEAQTAMETMHTKTTEANTL